MNDTEYRNLQLALATAELELDALDQQTRDAYRAYQTACNRQDIKADEVRELRRKARSAVLGGAPSLEMLAKEMFPADYAAITGSQPMDPAKVHAVKAELRRRQTPGGA